ncbi:MAG: TIM-barrel domain-containing protein [Thermoprotei archaeon]|jgi:alpha-glucosidase
MNASISISFKPLDIHIAKIVINNEKKHQKSFSIIREPLSEEATRVWDHQIKDNEIIVTWKNDYMLKFKFLDFDETHTEFLQYIDRDDRIYGLGEKYARLNRRFKRFHMWNIDQPVHLPSGDPTYVSVPFYIITNPKWSAGVFIDYPGYIYIDTGVKYSDSIFLNVKSNSFRMYLVVGNNIYDILKNYSELTGKPFMPPKWAIGYHQSRYSYMSQDEVLHIANEFRKRRIPCDAIYLDIHYMDGFKIFTWDSKNFPSPEKMIDALHSINIRLVTIVDVGVKALDGYEVFDNFNKIDGFLRTPNKELFLGAVWPGLCAFPDFLRSEVRKLWSSYIARWIKQGIDGIWLDMNEPSIFLMIDPLKDIIEQLPSIISGNGNVGLNIISEISKISTAMVNKNVGYIKINAIHKDDEGNMIHHDEIHNAYSLLENLATYEGFKKVYEDKRTFILSRSGFAGIQKFAAVWTGDNQADWGHMEISIPQLLSLGLSGIPFVGADVGGFSDDTDPELLVRWHQLGAFYPFYRNHSDINARRHEPWVFGEPFETIIKNTIKFRYKLLPYIYRLFIDAHRTGLPIMRTLSTEFPSDENCYDIDDEFMLGEALLIAPILAPGIKARAVYLPEVKWYDYWDGEILNHGWNLVKASLEIIPIFIRENTAILTTDPKENAYEPWDPIKIETFITKKVKTRVYDDDGETLKYQKGEYFEAEVEIIRDNNEIIVDTEILNKNYKPSFKNIELHILNGSGIENILINGIKHSFKIKEKTAIAKFTLE